jgi:4-amino-4-deoxy-L-arabinose transferase-like glycosyltransferase
MQTQKATRTISYTQYMYGVALLLILVKLALLPLASWTDADAVSRHLMTLDLMAEPHVINNGNWPPLYFYFQAAILSIMPSSWSPLVLQVILSSLAAICVFRAIKPWTSERSAFWSACVFALCPIVFRLSLMNMAETGYLFFVLLGAMLISHALAKDKWAGLWLGGVTLAIASGFRYEAFIVAMLISLFIWKKFGLKKAAVVVFTSSIFLCYWGYSNYVIWHNPARSLHWSAEAISNNEITNAEAFFRRLGWFPISLALCFGPAAWFFFFTQKNTLAQAWKTNRYSFLLPLFYLTLSIAMCLAGSLLLQHRFTLTSFLLPIPLISIVVEKLTQRQIVLWITIALGCTYTYPTKGLRPVPHWNLPLVEHMSAVAEETAITHPAFIMEFYDWEASYYMLHQVNLRSKDVLFIQGEKGVEFGGVIYDFINKHPKVVVFVDTRNAQLNAWIKEAFDMHHKTSEVILEEGNFLLLKYE